MEWSGLECKWNVVWNEWRWIMKYGVMEYEWSEIMEWNGLQLWNGVKYEKWPAIHDVYYSIAEKNLRWKWGGSWNETNDVWSEWSMDEWNGS